MFSDLVDCDLYVIYGGAEDSIPLYNPRFEISLEFLYAHIISKPYYLANYQIISYL